MVDGGRIAGPQPGTTPDWEHIARQHDQRQWSPPARPWIIRQTWRDLLFAHWPVAPEVLRPLIPAQLEMETFGGAAWIGVVPFDLRNLTSRYAPDRLGLSFPELNVRTYVTMQDRPGVWFFSLDAASLVAVRGARATYSLPYYWARMRIGQQDGWITYSSQRRGSTNARFLGRYRPTGPVFESAGEPGALALRALLPLHHEPHGSHHARGNQPCPLAVATCGSGDHDQLHGVSPWP